MKDNLLEFKATVMSAITTGVSYMLPFVVAGGILVAISFAIGGYDVGSAVEPCKTLASTLYYLGQIGLSTLMVPILGAFVAYSIADKPGICVGMYAGWIATDPWSIGYASGFLGALIGGIIAGYLVEALKKMPLPRSLKSLLPTLIIPLLGCGMIGLLMHYVLGGPLGALTTALTHFLDGLGTGNIIILGLVQGAMIAFGLCIFTGLHGNRKLSADCCRFCGCNGTSHGYGHCNDREKRLFYERRQKLHSWVHRRMPVYDH